MQSKQAKKQGREVRRARRAEGRRQAWLAEQLKVHPQTVGRWERDGLDPEHPVLPKIEAALGVPIRRVRARAEDDEDDGNAPLAA